MAKRRRVDVPSAADLAEVEAGFEVKSMSGRPAQIAPIAQVAADAAALSQTATPEDRARVARDTADAERFRAAEAEGRLVMEISADQVQTDEMIRDRAVLDAEAMAELKSSIASHGLRVPIDVFALEQGGYGLISGFRRLMAVRDLHGPDASIRAILRAPVDASDAYVAMVEENEVRSDLSHYERGRIAVLAVGQGAFPNVREAVRTLFAAGSKAKRSKIQSFAMIHEELADLMMFPTALGERLGLRVAAALKAGQGEVLRQALAQSHALTGDEEGQALSAALDRLDGKGAEKVSRAKPAGRDLGQPHRAPGGITLVRERDRHGFAIRVQGENVDDALVDRLLQAARSALRDA